MVICTILGYAHPFKRLRTNFVNLAGEAVILMIADLLLITSDPNLGVANRLALGWLIIVILGTSIIVSTGSSIYASLKESKLKCQRCNAQRLAKKMKKNAKLNAKNN